MSTEMMNCEGEVEEEVPQLQEHLQIPILTKNSDHTIVDFAAAAAVDSSLCIPSRQLLFVIVVESLIL